MSERLNGRKNDELREINFIKDYTKHALSSVLVQFGDTKVIVTATAEEKAPKWMEKDDPRGWITAEYSLLPTSTETRCQRERTKISGRTQEIQRLIGRSLRSCAVLEKMTGITITIDADVIQADGGTQAAAIDLRTVLLCGAMSEISIIIFSNNKHAQYRRRRNQRCKYYKGSMIGVDFSNGRIKRCVYSIYKLLLHCQKSFY